MNFLSLNILFAQNILLFKPLSSNVFEPRIGSTYNYTDDNLRLDIGASFDLVKFKKDTTNYLSIGADFFTYTRLNIENNFKFPVETSDYFFGINFSSKFCLFDNEFESRLRVAHISSHLVDGYTENNIFKKSPFVYSREFFDLYIAKYINFETGYIRPFVGTTVVFSTQPTDVAQFKAAIGLDFKFKLSDNFDLIGGSHIGNGENTINIASQAGINMHFLPNIGIFLGYYNYYGNSIHGMFYKNKDDYSGIGFQIIYN